MADEKSNRRVSDDVEDAKILDKILGFERSTHDKITGVSGKIQLIENDQRYMKERLDTLVSRLEFTPVKMLVYGMTSIILTGVVGALVALVLTK